MTTGYDIRNLSEFSRGDIIMAHTPCLTMEAYLQLGKELEEGVGEGALRQLGGQRQHGLQGQLP